MGENNIEYIASSSSSIYYIKKIYMCTYLIAFHNYKRTVLRFRTKGYKLNLLLVSSVKMLGRVCKIIIFVIIDRVIVIIVVRKSYYSYYYNH